MPGGQTRKAYVLHARLANGKPHIGHILTRSIKTCSPAKAMKVANVLRKAGWDTHGLPVGVEVETTVWTVKSRSSSMVCAHLLKNVKKRVGPIKVNGERICGILGGYKDPHHLATTTILNRPRSLLNPRKGLLQAQLFIVRARHHFRSSHEAARI